LPGSSGTRSQRDSGSSPIPRSRRIRVKVEYGTTIFSSSTSLSQIRCFQPSHSSWSRRRRSGSIRIFSLRLGGGTSPPSRMILRTALRLTRSRRAISRTPIPS
jgi:hypothetical protein